MAHNRVSRREACLGPVPKPVRILKGGYLKLTQWYVMRSTAATTALDHEANIAKVQEWLGHANIATTRLYDQRKTRPEDGRTFKVEY